MKPSKINTTFSAFPCNTYNLWFGNETRQPNSAARWWLYYPIAAFLQHLVSRVSHILTLWASQWNCSTISPGCGISCEDSTWKCSNWKWKYSAGNAWDWPNGMAIARLGHTGACALGFAPQVQAHLKTRTLLCYMVDPIWWPEGRQASCRKLLLHWPYHQLLSKQEE